MLIRKNEYDKMANVEQSLWWYRSLHNQISKAIHRSFGKNKEISILDAGCGTGGLILHLKEKGYANLKGFDLSDFAISYCRDRGLNVFAENILNAKNHFDPNTLDVIVSCDVLYFLEDQERRELIVDFYTLLKPGGILLLNLPALKMFSGIHDLSVGIQHRFHHKELDRLFDGKQFSLIKHYYWPLTLAPIISFDRAKQRKKIRSGKFEVESDIEMPSSIINNLLIGLMTFEQRFLPNINWGSSLFVIANKS